MIGGSSADAARAYYQNLQVENLARIMNNFEGPGHVIRVNYSLLAYDLGLQKGHTIVQKNGTIS